jgi:hypothetical protein
MPQSVRKQALLLLRSLLKAMLSRPARLALSRLARWAPSSSKGEYEEMSTLEDIEGQDCGVRVREDAGGAAGEGWRRAGAGVAEI